MKLIFAGTPAFACQALVHLHAAGHEIAWVLTQPDRPAGRGMKPQASQVKVWATAHHIAVLQPPSLKLDGRYQQEAAYAQQLILSTKADAIVVAAYGLILPPWMLDAPRLGCLNIHASLLPRWRGAAPVHRAIEAGDATTGITIMQMDAGLDTGAMLMSAQIPISGQDTTASLSDRLAALGGKMIVETLALAQAGDLKAGQPQLHENATYAHKIDKAESLINWHLPANVIERRIRAFDPYPGCKFRWGNDEAGETIKIWQAKVFPTAPKPSTPGQLWQFDSATGSPNWAVTCAEQALLLEVVQLAGGKRGPANDILRHLDLKKLPSSSSTSVGNGALSGQISRQV